MKKKIFALFNVIIMICGIVLSGCSGNNAYVHEKEKDKMTEESTDAEKTHRLRLSKEYRYMYADKNTVAIAMENMGKTEKYYMKAPGEAARGIACWGDSMMQGVGSEEGYVSSEDIQLDISYYTTPMTLEYFTSVKTYNFGVGGEDSYEIAVRAGGIPVYIDRDIDITVEKGQRVKLIDNEDDVVVMTDYSGYGFEENDYPDTVYINEVLCKVMPVEDSDEVYITVCGDYEGNNSDSLYATWGTRVIPKAAYDHCNDVLVIEMGSNGGWDNDYYKLIAQYKSIICNSYYKDYIIVGDTDDPGNSVDSTQAAYEDDGSYSGLVPTRWEQALSDAFGEHFLNTRMYLVQNGLSDCGLTQTMKDVLDIQKGIIPGQLRQDYTHFNAYGYYSKGKAIYQKGVELGYWR